jgi:hypothetical protein
MSKMGDLLIEIEELHNRGFNAEEISRFTGMTLRFILEAIETLEPEYSDEP